MIIFQKNVPQVVEIGRTIDVTSTEAFLVRKDGDGGDVFTVDTTNGQIIIPIENDPANPELTNVDKITGIYFGSTNEIRVSIAGVYEWGIDSTQLKAANAAGPAMVTENSSTTNPTVLPDRSSTTSGLGGGTDAPSMIVGGVEITRFDSSGLYMVSGDVRYSTTAGITASTTQTQGEQPLTTTINEVSTVAVANDVVTMPAATAGRWVVIIHNGAQTLQIFPASGDNFAGSAADASVTLAAGNRVQYVSYDAAEWESI